jgi:hypothetical protein
MEFSAAKNNNFEIVDLNLNVRRRMRKMHPDTVGLAASGCIPREEQMVRNGWLAKSAYCAGEAQGWVAGLADVA